MNPKILEALKVVHRYAEHIDVWVVIKKELLKNLHPSDRKLFSTRDPITKRQNMNDFERDVIKIWEEMTGRPVIFSNDEKAK